MSDSERTPRISLTWATCRDNALLRSKQMADVVLQAVVSRDFARAVKASDLRVWGERLANETVDWRRLAPDNVHRQAAVTEIFAFSVEADALMNGET